jgi:nitroreductase
MAADESNAVEVLLTRRSVPALQMREPGPSRAQIEIAINAALRAPDHGNLKPWRCLIIEGAARTRLSELFVRRMQQREPPAPAGKLEKARTMPLAAPLVIAVAAKVIADNKVPEVEQLLSSGAATMNLMNAFHAQGFAAIWLTGPNAYDGEITRALGFAADEHCQGFIYVGTGGWPAGSTPPKVDVSAHVRHWSG